MLSRFVLTPGSEEVFACSNTWPSSVLANLFQHHSTVGNGAMVHLYMHLTAHLRELVVACGHPHAGEMISELTVAIQMKATMDDFGGHCGGSNTSAQKKETNAYCPAPREKKKGTNSADNNQCVYFQLRYCQHFGHNVSSF